MGGQAATAGDTWGISGPAFLGLYALLVGAVVAVLVVRWWRPREQSAGAAAGPTPLHPYDLAYLNAGSGLAADTVIAGLRATGVLGPGEKTGMVALTGTPLPAGATGLERAGYSLARSLHWYSQLRVGLIDRPEMAEVRRRLEQAGLVLPDGAAGAYRRLALRLWLPVVGLGLLRLVVGLSRGKPVLYLVLLLAVAGIAAAASLAVRPWRSWAGHGVLREARRGCGGRAAAASTGAARYGPAGASYGVAVFGLSALWVSDPEFAGGISAPRLASGGDGGDGGSGGSCGGGGGCGGGGCGG